MAVILVIVTVLAMPGKTSPETARLQADAAMAPPNSQPSRRMDSATAEGYAKIDHIAEALRTAAEGDHFAEYLAEEFVLRAIPMHLQPDGNLAAMESRQAIN